MYSINLSRSQKLEVLKNGNFFLLGLIVAVLGLLVITLLKDSLDFQECHFILQKMSYSNGTVIQVDDTNWSFNDNGIYRFEYNFIHNDTMYQGTSFTSESVADENDKVSIEFVTNNPQISRIVEMNNAPLGLPAIGFLALFPIFGFGLILIDVFRLRRHMSILNNFGITTGILTDQNKKIMRIYGRPLYRLRYQYKLQDKILVNNTYSVSPEKYFDNELLIYSYSKPNISVLTKKLGREVRQQIRMFAPHGLK